MTANTYFDSQKTLNLSGMLVIAIIGSLALYTESNSALWPLVAFLALAIFTSFCAFLLVPSETQRHILFWILALLITLLFFVVRLDIVAILTIVWIVIAAELYGPRRAAVLAFASITTFVISQVYHFGVENLTNSLISAVLYGLLQIFALSVVLRGIRERSLHEETALLNRELIATRELLSQSAAQAERVRIARDLHDILGHHMTALILNLEVANHSVQHSSQSVVGDTHDTKYQQAQAKAQEKVEQALALAKLLLGDIRTAVSELREDDNIDLLTSIEKLTEGIPNPEFELDFVAAPQIRSVLLAETLLRCAQEAITNVIRHSGADRCQMVMRENDGKCVLLVADNGTKNREVVPGNGIRGMQERVIGQGGVLSWEQAEDGFALRIELPLGREDED